MIEETPLWPKKTTIHLHGDKDKNWEKGSDLGLSESAIMENFRHCLYEVSVEIEVNEDGTYKILGVKE